jgi:hypothetical protein
MADVWPADFPQKLLRAGNSGSLGDAQLEMQPDVGPPITRPRSSAVVDTLAGAMMFSEAGLAELKDFFRVTLMNGALPFLFPDQTSAQTPVLVKFPKGQGPRWNESGPDTYRVQISLMVLP